MTPWQVDRGQAQALKDRWAAGPTTKTVKEQTDPRGRREMGGQSDHWDDGQTDLVAKQRGRPTDSQTASLTTRSLMTDRQADGHSDSRDADKGEAGGQPAH